MKTRRVFFSAVFGYLTSFGLFLTPGAQWIGAAYAKVKKLLLPANTKMKDLIRKNPGKLDTRNLLETPLQDFQTMGETKYELPSEGWRLKVTGRVSNELSLSYMEMLDLPSVERKVLLICPGFFAQHGRWKGLDMQQILAKAVFEKDATKVTFSGPTDSYKSTNSFSIDLVLSNQVFLAYKVNGKTLPKKHGFPLRVVAEEAFGANWVKFVNSVIIE